MTPSDAPAHRSSPFRNVAGYALPWLPVAMLALYMKWAMLSQMGYLVVARSLGRSVNSLSWLDRAGLYWEDLVLGFVLIPTVLTVVVWLLPRRFRGPVTLGVSLAGLVFLFVNMMTYANVGRFMTPHLARDGVQWLVQNPAYLALYVSRSALVKFTFLVAAPPALAWIAYRLELVDRGAHRRRRGGRPKTMAVAGLVVAVLIVSAIHSPRLPGGYAASVLRQTASSALNLDRTAQDLGLTTPDELRHAYRELANLPPYHRSEELYGALAGYDVLFFILESVPSQVLDFHDDDLHDFPNIRRMLDRSLVATRHHSTYPYTYSALFSLFSGWYPTGVSLPLERGDRLSAAPMARLAERGYATAVYSPHQSQFTTDEISFPALGFQHYVVIDGGTDNPSASRVERMAASDRATLERMKEDMSRWLREGRRYAAVFLPQLSHGPWPDINGAGADNRARGRALLAREDAWLGELLDLLERHGRLEHTLIIVTADHGLRTREEEPTLPPGQIDDISFRVPLLLYAPKAFEKTTVIPWLTSHVDLAPTVLDLLGVSGDRELFQGLPLWDERLEHRRTFFLARDYLGADGLHDEQGFYMHNDYIGVDYEADHLHFGKEHLLRASDARASTGRARLATLRALQRRWLEVIAKPQRTGGDS
jgi:arylsulfatase A-like enzyme